MIASASFTITDLLDPVQQGMEPLHPTSGMLWLDTAVRPNALKRWSGTEWIPVNDVSAVSVGGRNLLRRTSDSPLTATQTTVLGSAEPGEAASAWHGWLTFLMRVSGVTGEWRARLDLTPGASAGAVLGQAVLGSMALGTDPRTVKTVVSGSTEEAAWLTVTAYAGPADCRVQAILERVSESGSAEYDSPKLELGNVPTQWMPAQEDVDDGITAAQSAADTAREEIESLDIGGRNLLRNTATLPMGTLIPDEGIWAFASNGAGEGELTEVEDPRVPVTAGARITGNTGGIRDLQTLVTTLEPDTEYTFSAWLRVVSEGTAHLLSRFCTTESVSASEETLLYTTHGGWFRWSAVKRTPPGLQPGTVTAFSIGVTGSSADIEIAAPKLEKGNRATDWSPAPEDADEALQLQLASVYAQISNEGDSLRSEVAANYARAADLSSVETRLATVAEQTETNYTWAVTQITQVKDDLDTAREAVGEELSVLRTYMTFGEDGLSIGKTGNPFTFRVVNDRLAFYMNDTEVAYLSNNKLYVTQAEILTRLIIGKLAFEPQSNGNLSLVFRG